LPNRSRRGDPAADAARSATPVAGASVQREYFAAGFGDIEDAVDSERDAENLPGCCVWYVHAARSCPTLAAVISASGV
jgi:hypothetical protein